MAGKLGHTLVKACAFGGVQNVRERVLLSVVVSAQGMAVPGGSGLAGAAGSSRSPMRLTQHQQQAQQLQQGGMQVGGAAIDPLARVVTPLSSYPSGT
eukprot:785237-Pelagomonas_calceolata.AAC.1